MKFIESYLPKNLLPTIHLVKTAAKKHYMLGWVLFALSIFMFSVGKTETIIQLFGIFLAAWVVVWQVGKQREGELLLQRENIKEEFKKKLHGEIEEKIQKLSDSSVMAGGVKYNLTGAFAMQQAAIAQQQTPAPLLLKMEDFNTAHNQLTKDVIEVINVIEKYEIIQPEIKIFQTAFNVAMADLREAYSPLMLVLMRVLPVRSQDGRIIYQPPPNPPQIATIQQLTSKYNDATNTIGCFVHDFRIEIQNLLLGKIFERQLPPRKPLNPRYIVISTKPEAIAQLQRYFEEETLWGKQKQQSEEQVKQTLLASPNAQQS